MDIEEARKHLKKNLNNWKKSKKDNGYMPEIMEEINTDYEAIETLLTAYEKEKETSHYIQSQLDIANAKLVEEKEKNKELKKENVEIREWKYVIDNPIDLDKLKELDLIKIKGKEYVSKDKIKAKIEEVDYKMIAHQDVREAVKQALQSLLEKE